MTFESNNLAKSASALAHIIRNRLKFACNQLLVSIERSPKSCLDDRDGRGALGIDSRIRIKVSNSTSSQRFLSVLDETRLMTLDEAEKENGKESKG